jgi:hypothetical protein
LEDTGGNILGQVNENGSRSSTCGDFESLIDSPWEFSNVLDEDVPLCARPCDTDHVSLLESIGSNCAGNDLTAENNQGCSVHQRILHGCDDVGGTGSRSNEHNTGLSTCAGVTLCHVAGTLFMSRKDKVEVF